MKTNKEIITEVTFLLALKNGFDGVSIKEIQKASGVSAGSIYYHFKDKNEILFHMVNEYLIENFYKYGDSIKSSNYSFIEKVENIFYYLLSFNKKDFQSLNGSVLQERENIEYFGLFSSIFHHHPETRPLFYKLHEESYKFYKGLVDDAIEKKEINEGVDARRFTIFIHTIFKGYIDLCVFHPELSIEELVEANLRIIEDVIKSPN